MPKVLDINHIDNLYPIEAVCIHLWLKNLENPLKRFFVCLFHKIPRYLKNIEIMRNLDIIITTLHIKMNLVYTIHIESIITKA